MSIWLAHTSTVLENCEDAWNEYTAGSITAAANTDKMVGTNAVKILAGGSISANTVLATEAVSSTDLSSCTHLVVWVKSSATVAAGAFQLLIDEDASCASPSESLDLPALTADRWQRCVLTCVGATSARNALISVGIKAVSSMSGGQYLLVDDIRGITAKQYATLGVRGLDYPDDEESNNEQTTKLLSGSYREVISTSQVRHITVDFGVVNTKSDLTWLTAFRRKSEKHVISTYDDVEVVNGEAGFTLDWKDNTSLGRSVVLKFIEKTARTSDPVSWGYE